MAITKPGMQNAHWKPWPFDDRLLHRVQLAVGRGEAFDADDLLAAHAMRQRRARIPRHIVHQHGARAAFRAIASELGAGEAQLVAQRHRERLVLQHVNAALLAVDVERDDTLDRAGHAVVLADHVVRKRYADAETVAPAAITPLMKLRRETPG